MTPLQLTVILMATVFTIGPAARQSVPQVNRAQPAVLVHVTQGPENPTRAALAFLVAKQLSTMATAPHSFWRATRSS